MLRTWLASTITVAIVALQQASPEVFIVGLIVGTVASILAWPAD